MQDATQNFAIKQILIRGAKNGVIFTTLWTAWAYYANLNVGVEAAKQAAFTQAGFTIINSFAYSVIMEYLFSLGKTKLSRFLLASMIPNILVTISLVSIHIVRGTPNVAVTVMPPLSIIFLLSFMYVFYIGPKKLSLVDNELA